MSSLAEGFFEALSLIITFDPDLMGIVFLSLRISLTAILLATLAGVPLGTWLGLKPAAKTRFVTKVLYTLMGMPPVLVGLVFYLVFSRQGPLGVLGLLYTPIAMVIAQIVLALPIVTGLTMVGIRSMGKDVSETARTLGAGDFLTALTVVREARFTIMGAVVSGFGRITSEVAAVMIVGANIQGYTRVMTTAIVLETNKGDFGFAMGLGLCLLALSFIVNSLLYRFQEGDN